MSTSSPTLFRTEAITKLGEAVDGIQMDIRALETDISSVRSIAEQALELAQSGGSDEAYDAADEVQEADDEVVENLLNYDQYNFSSLQATTTYFNMNSCKARKYKDGTMRFFLTITTKSFPALGIANGLTSEAIISSTYLNASDTVLLKVMGGYTWVYIDSNGLQCNLSSFQQCSPGEQYTIACEISADDVNKITISDSVPKETIEVSMPDGTTAYDYTYDITTEVNNLQSKTQTNITFSSIRMVIRNYDRYYAHFSYSGVFKQARNASTSAQALTSDYITATAELYPSPSSSTGDTNFLPYIYPTQGLVFINQDAVSKGDSFSGETTIICPLSATMTINTSNLKQLESNGGKLKATSAASVQSSLVRYKLYNINSTYWTGSVNFVQDQLGVFVILSIGNSNISATIQELSAVLENIVLPISLNTRLEVYTFINQFKNKYIIGSDNRINLVLQKLEGERLKLALTGDQDTYSNHCTCIRGLIPGAYLHTEDTIATSYGEDEETV